MFGSKENLQHLENCEEIFMDGTFWVCPFNFKQLFTIHGFILGQSFPLIYFLLPNKATRTYEKAFDMLNEVMANYQCLFWKLKTVFSDFESGLSAAIESRFSFAGHTGCFFHFAQCIYRKVNDMGLANKYKSDKEFKLKIKMFIALGLTPSANRSIYLNELHTFLCSEENFDEHVMQFYNSYFLPNWINKKSWILWDWYLKENRTNNNVESWHSSLQRVMQSAHLPFFKFILILKGEYENIAIKIKERNLGENIPPKNPKYKERNVRIQNIQKEIHLRDPIPYLKSLAHNAPNPDCFPENSESECM